jgi:hypothetical protein
VTSLSILTNHFTKKNEQNLMLPSVGVASAKDGGDGGASVIDGARV